MDNNSEHLNYVSQIVTAYVTRNDIPHQDVPLFMEKVSETLRRCIQTDNVQVVAGQSIPPLPPGVKIEETVFPDYIICLEDGKKYQTMKRHLSVLGMSPEDYRRKWGLPTDYPMVCETYSARRSKLAQHAKLGHRVEVKAPAHTPASKKRAENVAPQKAGKRK